MKSPKHQPSGLEFLRRVDGNHITLRGELTFATVASGLKAVSILLQPGRVLRFDMSGITRADSVAAALLIEWIRMATHARCELRFSRLPVSLQAIIDVASLGEILPVESFTDSTESTFKSGLLDG